MLGVGSYGVREIAKCKKSFLKRSYVASNLFYINAILTIVAILILLFLSFNVSEFVQYQKFFFVGVCKLIFNLFLIEWFFQGLQNFAYITKRSLVVRLVYVAAIFIFIRDENDALYYYALQVMIVVLNSVLNWNYARNFFKLSLRFFHPQKFIASVASFGYYRLLTSMYTTFNMVFLGFVCTTDEVGYFATATKLYSIIMSVFTAFTVVMVPRVSEMLKNREVEALQDIANKTFGLMMPISVALICYCLCCAPNIIMLLAGQGYEGAIIPFRIVIFLLVVIGMEQVVIQQFLMASKSNKSILAVRTLGAVVGVGLNVVLTPSLGAVGSSIAWGVSEMSVLFLGVRFMKKIMGINLDYRNIIKNMSFGLLYLMVLIPCHYLKLDFFFDLFVCGIVCSVSFLFVNMKINPNPHLMNMIFNRIRIKK